MKRYSLVIALLLLTSLSAAKPTVNVVLIGATGNLAQKYLWQALFELPATNTTRDFRFIGAARDTAEAGEPAVKRLVNKVECAGIHEPDRCQEKKAQFLSTVQYHQLKTEADYTSLGKILNQQEDQIGRIFYLSVPPSSYSTIAAWINQHCRGDSNTFLRVVLEKPFGTDLTSAQNLAADLNKFLKEEEIYRIDHYLGKTVVKNIIQFRQANPQLNEYWNNRHISKIEVAMFEKEDCSGRTSFYNNVGVIRDVFQNHLTEVLSLVALDMPALTASESSESVTKAKQQFLKTVSEAEITRAVIGQYDNYRKHYLNDHKITEGQTNTPTYATVPLTASANWKGTSILLHSGKQLFRREAYTKVTFRASSQACVLDDKHSPCYILFQIQGGYPHSSYIESNGIQLYEWSNWSNNINKQTNTLLPHETETNSYSSLIAAVAAGDQSLFVSTSSLLESWRIWTKIATLTNFPSLVIYPSGSHAPIISPTTQREEL